MSAVEEQDRLAEIVNQIVARAKENGSVVTVHKHYTPATTYAARGFFFAAGVSTYAAFCLAGAYLWKLLT